MFCGKCGNKVVEGDQFCATCGRANRPASTSEFVAVPVLPDGSETVAGGPQIDPASSARVQGVEPGEMPSYCRHSAKERGMLGIDMHHGSDVCLGCKLPYTPECNSSLFVPDPKRVESAAPVKKWFLQNKILTGIVVTLVGVLAVVLFTSSRTQGQDQLNAPTASAPQLSGPTASVMGCTDAWTLEKTTNGINIFDCSTAYGNGHQTLWRFDDAGAQASFMDTMSRAIRPKGHLVYTDNWAIISDNTESFRAAINAGGQDYGS